MNSSVLWNAHFGDNWFIALVAFYKWDNWGNDRWRHLLKDTQLLVVCDGDSIQIGLFDTYIHAPSIMTKSFWLIQKYTVSGFRHQNDGRLLNIILPTEGMFLSECSMAE